MASSHISPSPDPSSPRPIKRLHESLINRIAAGEIIHRPASALKELLENSLDAGSTSIQVTVKDGGMKLLQIQDNGCGIHKDDLHLLAERFTTSKLSTFSDLSKLTTYGFRGEALASISHVSHLTVITKTKSDTCAWKAAYADGVLVPSKAGYTPDPKPCAGNNGTTTIIEDMFYNTPTRLSALRSSSEEYARILDVMTKYSVHNSKVSFVCKKSGSLNPELSTPSCSDTSLAIRQLYGHSIAKELLHVTTSSKSNGSTEAGDEDDPEAWSAEAYFTNANYQGKKTAFLLFINHRLVESSRMKRSIESIYSGILPKGSSPFVYLSINLDPRSVDVNVHPTKREVHFLNEEAIIERISDAIQQKVAGQSQSRVFEYQTLLTGGIAPSASRKGKEKATNSDEVERDEEGQLEGDHRSSVSQVAKKVLSQHKVRTSLKDRTLDSMIPVTDPLRTDSDEPATAIRLRDIKESTCHFASITELRRLANKRIHHDLTEIIKKHTFVGVIDLPRCLTLIQHNKNLYMVNHAALAEELFYQLALLQFGDYSRLRLDPPPSLRMLVKLAVEVEEGTERSGMNKDEIINRIVQTLMDRREMLLEYFSFEISETGDVKTLPHLLREYTPNLDKLPMFLMRLGPQVHWESEQECFNSFMRELAYFYSPAPLSMVSAPASDEGEQAKQKAEAWRVQNILFHVMRKYLAAPKSLLENDVVQVASLPDLYRVFERC